MPESVVVEAATFKSIPEYTTPAAAAVVEIPAPAEPEKVTSAAAIPAVRNTAVVARRMLPRRFDKKPR